MIRNLPAMFLSIVIIGLFTIAMLVPVQYLPFDTSYDKVKHAAFFVFITLSISACINLSIWKIAIFVSLFAVLSEVAQHYLPYRSGSLDDLIADLLGVLIGCILAKVISVSYFLIKNSIK